MSACARRRRPVVCVPAADSPLVYGGRGASTSCPDSTALQGDDFVLCARHVPRHTKAVCGRCVRCVCGAPHTHRALRLVQARGNGVCVLLSCHDGLAWGVHVAVRLPVSQSCCYLWEDSLCAGSLLGDLLLATSPGPCACSWSNTVQPFSGKNRSCLPSTRLTANAPSKESASYTAPAAPAPAQLEGLPDWRWSKGGSRCAAKAR